MTWCSPIYGVSGAEARAIPFLGPAWVEMLRFTLRQARDLDLGVDMITGTGWPLGAPWVGADDAAAKVLYESYRVAGGGRLELPLTDCGSPRAVMAFSDNGRVRVTGGEQYDAR